MINISKKVKLALRSILLKAGELATDKGQLLYEGELEVGTEVFQEVEGEIVPAADGEYVAENKVIVVKEGRVDEIRDKGDDNAEEETSEEAEEVAEEVAEEIETAEEAADPADEPEQVEEETEEERIARLEASMAEIREGIEALTNAIAAVVERLEAVEEKIKGLDEPGADPAEQGEETEQQFTSKLNYLKKN